MKETWKSMFKINLKSKKKKSLNQGNISWESYLSFEVLYQLCQAQLLGKCNKMFFFFF